MSGKFVIKKERTRYRFELLDETGEVVFKGSVNTTKAAVERQLKLIAEFGDDLPNHFQAVEGRIGNTWVIRGEEHSAREGEQGRVGDAIPLGFGVLVGDKEEVLATKDRIVAAAKGATGGRPDGRVATLGARPVPMRPRLAVPSESEKETRFRRCATDHRKPRSRLPRRRAPRPRSALPVGQASR